MTLIDTKTLKIGAITKVIDNGDDAPGTILENIKKEFKDLFYKLDIVMTKGQWNYKTLSNIDKTNVFLLFITKCEVVAKKIDVKPISFICIERGNYSINK